MSKRDAIQNAINVSSLMMNVEADVAKALQKSETHPELAKIIMRLHHAQHELDKRVKDLQKENIQAAQIINMMATQFGHIELQITNLAQETGSNLGVVFGTENITEETR